MALQITETRGIFSVHGALNSSNSAILKRHMNRFLNPDKKIVLNLGRLKSIDKGASYVLQNMYKKAAKLNIAFSIIGLQNKNIMPVMKATKTSYILSYDHH